MSDDRFAGKVLKSAMAADWESPGCEQRASLLVLAFVSIVVLQITPARDVQAAEPQPQAVGQVSPEDPLEPFATFGDAWFRYGQSVSSLCFSPDGKLLRAAVVIGEQLSRFRDAYLGTALRTDRYRYVEWVETKTGDVSHRELYDHQSDSAELNNLADEPQFEKLIQKLSARIGRPHE